MDFQSETIYNTIRKRLVLICPLTSLELKCSLRLLRHGFQLRGEEGILYPIIR